MVILIQNGWEFVIDINQIHIPTDIEVDPYEVNSIVLQSNQIQHFAVTTAQFGEMFDRFCFANITRLNRSKSWKKLRETLIHFAEYYLGIFEVEARKIYLYPQNKEFLVQHIVEALESFDTWQKARGNDNKRVENSNWEVPEVRYYSENYNRQEVDSHALDPFFEINNVSKPEETFKKYLIDNESHIEWWYKNGDSGRENFAVDYFNANKELKLFYVDFVIKFKSGKIGLFDTKTKRSDSEAPNKHNALLDFIEKENNENTKRELIGGIMIPETNGDVLSFRYPEFRIDDTNDLTGWSFFKPAIING
jgi:type III restriction enzyme